MAATPAGEQSLVFILQPLFLHGISAAAHLVLALAVAGRFLFRRLGRTLSGGRAKGGDVGQDTAGRGTDGSSRCYGVAVCTTWALAAFEDRSSSPSTRGMRLLAPAAGRATRSRSRWTRRRARWRGCCSPRTCSSASGGSATGSGSQRRSGSGGRCSSCSQSSPSASTRWRASTGSPCPAARGRATPSLLSQQRFYSQLGSSEGGMDAAIAQEPLLIGAHEAAADDNCGSAADTSLLAGASFLSMLTFSWMGPLLAVGHSKTLGLDDVPGLEPGDRVAGLLPHFKANLEALTGDGDSSGRKVVTALKLTRALLRTVRWHVAVTALYSLVYNVATYVGPYLIDSLVQYLNGDERYASQGQLEECEYSILSVMSELSTVRCDRALGH
ncbi:hypothetical protein PVAP13_2NG031800 [Panicum virgatum]|uniref:ABC transmembrane type-1 domain-containing protein n=1 Tax=Panicum virgatum TaxID=38727 RepID=A0A8T0VVK9_PANVG|nr:hypothetical protein PVAP13_2NG031800 [Panicum virgatum]